MKNFFTALAATVALAGLAPVQPAESTLPPCPRGVIVDSGDLYVLEKIAKKFPGARYCTVEGGRVKQIFATSKVSLIIEVSKVARTRTYFLQ